MEDAAVDDERQGVMRVVECKSSLLRLQGTKQCAQFVALLPLADARCMTMCWTYVDARDRPYCPNQHPYLAAT